MSLILLILQEQSPAFRWTYIWLASGGVLLVLVILAFAYLLAKRHWARFDRVIRHPVLQEVDGMLSDRFPGFWGFIRSRFSVNQWRGLALTVCAVVLFSALYVFALVTESWTNEEALYAFDHRIYGWLVDAMDPTALSIMSILTHFGDLIVIAVLSVVVGAYLLLRGHRWRFVELFTTVGVGAAVMWGLKLLFGRARPEERIVEAAGHSFPSGHAFMSAALYAFLIYLTWRMVRSDGARIGVTIGLALVIFLTGLSRIVLRVHWVSDVLGGFVAGFAWLVSSLIITQAIRYYRAGRPTVGSGRSAPP